MKNIIDQSNEDNLYKVVYEVEIMRRIRHPKLIHFYGYWLDENGKTSWLIDIAPGGDLFEFLHESKFK